jgi:TonB-dependent receptor
MRSTVKATTKSLLLGSTFLAAASFLFAVPATAQDANAGADNSVETVVVTGYRASLTDATNAKRASVGFSDTVFAEDIGKFPDSNVAEAFNRIPGVTITRDIDGEGVNVQIRGLGSSFTKVLLNGSQVAMSSTGTTDAQGTNREVDLNMLPVELFTQLTVDKSARADLLEGGAAGTVNMRSLRAFDNPGFHLTYNAQGASPSNDHAAVGEKGTLIVSDTEGPFGILVGLTGHENHQYTSGFETIGWTTPKLNAAMCPANDCSPIGGGNWTIPATVPANTTTGGLIPGQTVNAALLTQLNPGLTPEQIGTALIPRLGRSMYEKGTRAVYNGTVSLEYRPNDNMHFYLDMIGGRLNNNMDRSDMDWVGRNGAMIPENLKLDSNGVVTSGTFANTSFFLEARPYKEKEDFFSVNPGLDWQVTDMLKVSLQANATRSHFFRDSPTILVSTVASAGNPAGVPGPTPPAGGAFVTYTGGGVPSIKTNINLNDPANFQWQGGRVNLQDEKRYTYTNGIHANAQYGGDEFNIKGGFAYDEAYRNITGFNNDQAWQNAICGDNPNDLLPGPNSQPSCSGLNVAGSAATVQAAAPGAKIPSYPGLGRNYSAGNTTTLMYQGSLIPQSALAGYLLPGPAGFISANYPKIEAASHYASFDYPNAPVATGTNTGASAGLVDEKDWGLYAEANGVENIAGRDLKFNLGLRWVETHQTIGGFVAHTDPRNATLNSTTDDGGLYPSYNTFTVTKHTYQSFLPSVNFVYQVADDFDVRLSLSRTMTRPNPSAMLPGVSFGDPSAATATVGNPALAPYYSNNIDIGGELYTGGEGYVGASVFRKALSGFTVVGTTTEPFSYLAQYGIQYSTVSPTQQVALQARGCTSDANCNTDVTIQKQVNAQGLLTVNGIEVDWVQPLDFLLEQYGLKGFGFTANMTIVDQKGSGAAPAIATGVAPFTYNLTGYYENNGAMVRLSYNFTDQAYSSGSNQNGICLPSAASAGCPQGAYLFSAPYAQADFSSSYKLANLFGDLPSDPEVTFDIQNVFKAKLKSNFQYPSAPFTFYNQGSVYLLGIRGTF